MEYNISMTAIPEIIIPDKRLGRNVYHDEQSRLFPAAKAAKLSSANHARHGDPVFNQGNLGSCTGNALAAALMTEPLFRNGRTLDQGAARLLYALATHDDGFPGEWPGADTGSNGVSVCKGAQQVGWIKSYTHTFTLNDALLALVLGPVIIGINWYDSFDKPQPDGELKFTNSSVLRGGHELVLRSVDVPNKRVGGDNSWGPNWGPIGGRFVMSWDTFAALLAKRGDVTIPVM